jgi:glycosyltransferase involved in cell wall biosynthesis
MHIIALSSIPTASRGGQELSLLEVCLSLFKRGHKITLLHINKGDLLPKYREFCTHVIQVSSYKLLRKKDIFQFLADFLKVPHVQDGVVYSNQYHDCVMAYALAKTRNIPLICHIRTPAPKELDTSDWQLTTSLKGVNQFIAVSNQTKLGWVKLGFKEEQFQVVHNGCNSAVFKPVDNFSKLRQDWTIPLDKKVISYVGRLDSIKGVETLIKAFSRLLENGTDAQLLIAGQPVYGDAKDRSTYLQSLKQLAVNVGIQDHVQFLGLVSDTPSLYQVSDITVLPSLYSEPFARSVIESLSCGVPVVGSRIGGIPEVLTGEFQSWLFEAGNEVDLFSKLTNLLNWRSIDSQLAQRCRNHIEQNFSLTRTIDKIEQIMLSCLR